MLYTKLPVVLLSVLAAEKNGSTNGVLAEYILRHTKEVAGMGIKELAKSCHVGVGSVSRFCREIGLEGYGELQALVTSPDFSFQRLSLPPEELAGQIGEGLRQAAVSVDRAAVTALCREILSFPKVAAFGLMKAESAAICLQSDLLMLGRQIYTNISYSEQLDYIAHADAETLILLFSYTGAYFAYPGEPFAGEALYPPQIALITGSDAPQPAYIDHLIRFSSRLDQASHPYQLELMAGLLAQECARLLDIS